MTTATLPPTGEGRSKANGRRARRWRVSVIGAWITLLALLSARTIRRNQDWQSDETLYRSGVPLNPPKGKSPCMAE